MTLKSRVLQSEDHLKKENWFKPSSDHTPGLPEAVLCKVDAEICSQESLMQ